MKRSGFYWFGGIALLIFTDGCASFKPSSESADIAASLPWTNANYRPEDHPEIEYPCAAMIADSFNSAVHGR